MLDIVRAETAKALEQAQEVSTGSCASEHRRQVPRRKCALRRLFVALSFTCAGFEHCSRSRGSTILALSAVGRHRVRFDITTNPARRNERRAPGA